MADIILNPIISSVSGRLGNIVFFTRYGKQYARIYVTPHNRNSEKQRRRRRLFAEAVRMWHQLTLKEKNKISGIAQLKGRCGYHLYISEYMKKDQVCPGPIDKKKEYNINSPLNSCRYSNDTAPLRYRITMTSLPVRDPCIIRTNGLNQSFCSFSATPGPSQAPH